MANEYLTRTPTSTGNRRVWTWSCWFKLNDTVPTDGWAWLYNTSTNGGIVINFDVPTYSSQLFFYDNGGTETVFWDPVFRDTSAWYHILVVYNSTRINNSSERVLAYVNGVMLNESTALASTYPAQNVQSSWNSNIVHSIGRWENGGSRYIKGQYSDQFFIDGQALTPDVFGFYKEGKGYISAGSTQATDFRPGQWVPKTPRVIKTEIIRRGGFGVNGFYLPMNDSNNFGADFHGEPNSIITLNEKLPQPRVGVATTASVGLGYTDALRADPYAANLVLALPFVSGGLSSGFGDYAPSIKGSGTPVSLTNAGVSIASTSGYYGSAAFFNNANTSGTIKLTGNDAAVNFGSGDWTVESWIFPTQLYNYLDVIGTRPDNGGYADAWHMGIDAAGTIGIYSNAYDVQTPAIIKANQWTHIAAVRKSNTLTMYVNGVAAAINTNYTKTPTRTLFGIGQFPSSNQEAFSGYLQDLRVYKGVAKYTGGFDVPRPYTPVGIATWRAVPDTTANNFATLNPLAERQAQKGTISAGNLRYDGTLNQQPEITSTVGVSTGKWYYEVYTGTKGDGGDSHFIGICNRSANSNGTTITIPSANTSGTRPTVGIANRFSTQLALYDQNNTYDISGTSGWWADGSVVGFAFDINNNSISVYKNGVLGFTSTVSLSYVATGIGTTVGQGAWSPWLSFESSASRTPASNWVMNFGQNPTFSGNTTAGTFTDSNGKGLFKYQPPSGFLALCEDNLPTPAISNPGQYFKTVLYTGDGNNGRSIVGVGFTPDLVWIKSRSPSAYNHRAFDSVRGAGKDNFLLPNSTAVEGASSDYFGGISSFNNDGFSMVYGTGGSNIGINESGTSFVAWCWRAGAGTTSTNTNGSITSVVSVNQDTGFSIVSYTGTGSGATVGHGLGKTPGFIIIKRRSGLSDWAVYHKSIGTTGALILNSTTGTDTNRLPYWNDTSPTITTFGLGNGNNVNASTSTYIAYCWAEIEGFSKFGSYSANFSADGPFCYCGFRPAFVIIKRTDSTGSWVLKDSSRNSANPADLSILAQTSDTEFSNNSPIDFLSNGFKLRSTSLNDSGATFIFAAWAESPFQTANSK